MDIRVPHLADGVESGTVVNVLVHVGDAVKKDQTLVELETEKAVAAIPAPSDGTVSAINIKRDDKVAVGQVIMTLSAGGAAKSPSNGHGQQAVTVDVEAPPVAQREALPRQSVPPAPAPSRHPAPAPAQRR